MALAASHSHRKATAVRVIRVGATDEAASRQVLFPDRTIVRGGRIAIAIESGATSEQMPIDVDADGDGAFETMVMPAATLSRTGTAPAIPSPQPFELDLVAFRGDPEDLTAQLVFPDAGGPSWTWAAETNADWIALSSEAGRMPEEVAITLASTVLAPGTYRDTLAVTLRYESYEVFYPVPVTLEIFETPSRSLIEVAPSFVTLARRQSQDFTSTGFDQGYRAFSFTPHWSAAGGTMAQDGAYTAGDVPGTYEVTASSGGLSARALVTITDEVYVGTSDERLPAAFALHQNYPNPFNPRTTIPYEVKEPVHVVLEVYDMLGRRVATLVDGDHAAGRYEAVFDASGLSSGLYFYVARMGAFREGRGMVVMR